MIYQPAMTAEMWDTWMYYERGVHYLFYLHKSDLAVWDGISLATSTDGVHFRERGAIIEKSADAAWLGTGSTWKVEDHYVLNFSEERSGVQGIYFATSPDLLNWTVCRDMPALQPDPRWYDNTETGRWDCIWVVKTAEGRYTGYLTARPWSGDSGLTYESVGKVVSADGLHFSAARPPRFVWNGLPRMNVFEVGAVERIHGRYYMIIAMAEEELGNRQLWRQNMGNTGMYCFTSDSLDGPFALQKENPRLLVSKDRMTYFARFYRCGEQMLLSHHAIERCDYAKKRAGVWMAPLKSAKPDDNGVLRLGYYEGNEALKGEAIELTRDQCRCVYPLIGDRDYDMDGSRVHIRHLDLGKILMMGTAFDPYEGVILEATVRINEISTHSGGAGFYFQHVLEPGASPSARVRIGIPGHQPNADLPHGTGVFFSSKGTCEIGMLWEKGKYDVDNVSEIPFDARQEHRVLLLSRMSMLEVYLDGWLVECYSMAAFPTGRFGFACENADVTFGGIKVWKMRLA